MSKFEVWFFKVKFQLVRRVLNGLTKRQSNKRRRFFSLFPTYYPESGFLIKTHAPDFFVALLLLYCSTRLLSNREHLQKFERRSDFWHLYRYVNRYLNRCSWRLRVIRE